MKFKLDLPGTKMVRSSRQPSLRVHIARERRVLMQITAGQPLSQVLHGMLADIEESARHNLQASILELTEDGRRLHHLAAPSLPKAYLEAIDGTEIGEGVGSCGTVVHRGSPVYVSDIAIDPLWANYCDLALSHGLRACWSTPIQGMDGATLGTFAVYYDVPRSPQPDDLEAIAAITLTVALVIERHRCNLQLARQR
jgi:GAF domain-containing protein